MTNLSDHHIPTLYIACLCAQWCGTCNEYAPLFAQLRADFPHARLAWVDIEDQADLVDPVEVENFPTILIAVDARVRFFGTVTPHIETLRRLIQSHQEDHHASSVNAQTQALLERLWRT